MFKKKKIQWSLEGCTQVFESFPKEEKYTQTISENSRSPGRRCFHRCFGIYNLLCLGPCELFSMDHLDRVEKRRFICQSQSAIDTGGTAIPMGLQA